MTAPLVRRALALDRGRTGARSAAAEAKDRPFDHDWRTGVTVAPGAMTWTDDNYEQKKALINGHRRGARQDVQPLRLPWLAAGLGRRPLVLIDADTQELRGGRLHGRGKAGRHPDRIHLDRHQRRPRGGHPVGARRRLDDLPVVPHGRRAGAQRRKVPLRRRPLGARARRLAWRPLADQARARAGRRQHELAVGAGRRRNRAASKPTAPRAATQYMAKVAYDYTVDGTAYSGDRLRFGNTRGRAGGGGSRRGEVPGGRAGGSSLRSGQAADLDAGSRAERIERVGSGAGDHRRD